ncbi:MAG: hypothetical protein CL609_02870 [Anaerolineaceae bacterium]|nr:hypothetical protein [Anaerolineaceae bacterium]
MKKRKSIFQYLGGIILLCGFAFILFLVFDNFRLNQSNNSQQIENGYPPPTEPCYSATVEPGYPAPIEPCKSLPSDSGYPAPVEQTETPVVKLTPTLQNTPFPTEVINHYTPYPTLTIVPGPTSTPVPLREPAKDSSGQLIFFGKSEKDDLANVFTLDVDEEAKNPINFKEISNVSIEKYTSIFPSPDRSLLALSEPWGVIGIINTQKESYDVKFFSTTSTGSVFNWLPNNRHLIIGNSGIAIMDSVNGEITGLAGSGFTGTTSAAGSPDGQYIVFGYYGDFIFEHGLWIIETTGRNQRLLSPGETPYLISWSPDGKKIVFHAIDWTVINADGTDKKIIAPDIRFHQCYDTPPVWSPDSKTIAIVNSKSGSAFCGGWANKIFEDTNIVLVDIESGAARPLLNDGVIGNISPAWSPDGSKLAFISNRSGTPEIWVVNADGSNLTQITKNDIDEYFVTWVGQKY